MSANESNVLDHSLAQLELERFRQTEIGGEIEALYVDPRNSRNLVGTVTSGFRVGRDVFRRGDVVNVSIGRDWGFVSQRSLVQHKTAH